MVPDLARAGCLSAARDIETRNSIHIWILPHTAYLWVFDQILVHQVHFAKNAVARLEDLSFPPLLTVLTLQRRTLLNL
jgi:hypothetical protein